MATNSHQTARVKNGAYAAPSKLSPEDELILRSPVSDRLKAEFFEDYLSQRRDIQVVEMLFERVGAFRLTQSAPPNHVDADGFRRIVFKGPLVEGANWFQRRGWDFAVPMERRLLQRLAEALRSATDGRLAGEVTREAEALVLAFEDMTRELASLTYRPTLLAVAGDLGTQLYIDLTKKVTPDWDPRVEAALRTTYRILGMYRDIPILEIPGGEEPAVYAVDLARFATLTRYGEQPVFEIEEFTEDRAREILARQPRLILDPPPESGLDDERIRQLQLRVGLDLWEMYELTVKDPNAVIGRPLVGPIPG